MRRVLLCLLLNRHNLPDACEIGQAARCSRCFQQFDAWEEWEDIGAADRKWMSPTGHLVRMRQSCS